MALPARIFPWVEGIMNKFPCLAFHVIPSVGWDLLQSPPSYMLTDYLTNFNQYYSSAVFECPIAFGGSQVHSPSTTSRVRAAFFFSIGCLMRGNRGSRACTERS
jgi:hypothetical protein